MTAYLALFCRLLVGGLFAVSALAKLRDVAGFRAALSGYRLLPRAAEPAVVVAVIVAEALVPVLLGFRMTAPLGLVLAAVLLAGFAVAMASVLRRGLATDCGCVGRGSTVRRAHLWRNLVLVAVCLAGAAAAPQAGAVTDPAVVAVLAVAAGCGVATLVFFDDLLLLFSTPAGRDRS